LLAVAFASRLAWGQGFGRQALLLSLACLGLLVHAHMMLPDLPLMAGISLALAGFAAAARGRPGAGVLVGLGTGIGFLGKGLIAPGVIGITALALPACFAEWRQRGYLRFLLLAALSAAPLLLIWPLALYLRSPDLFGVWFWDNNVGRFLGFSVAHLGAGHEPGFLWQTYPWFLFPGGLFALVALAQAGRRGWHLPGVQIGATFLVVMGTVLGVSASARAVYLLPMIPAVALLGAGAATRVPAWLDRLLGALGGVLGLGALVLFWPVWGLLLADGQAPAWPWLLHWLPATFAMPFSLPAVTAAAALTLGIVPVIVRQLGRAGNGLLIWVLSLTLAWGLAATLWLPWVDAARSYRAVFESLAAALPRDAGCVASRNLGESERAMLDYFAHLRTRRVEIVDASSCPLFLVQSRVDVYPPGPEAWTLVWSGARAGDCRESFQLYRAPPGS
jgi:4-amino-4-deoxy-L-arabinose transferase-like glycosyltransferase